MIPRLVVVNKVLAIPAIVGAFCYYIPKTFHMLHWTESGVISGYFFLLAPINALMIGFGAISLLSFMKKYNAKKAYWLLANNLIGVSLMILWYPIISSS